MNNEECCFPEFYARIKTALTDIDYELVFVDDGSTDSTLTLIKQAATNDKRVVGLALARNSGQWAAVDAGIQASSGRYVVIMDGDLQHQPEDVPHLLEKARTGVDLVSGVRQKRQEAYLLRRLPSKAANFLLRSLTKCPSRDMGGFKCLRGDLARSMRLRPGHHRLLPALVFLRGGCVADIPVSAPPRFAGVSHYGFSRSLDVFFDILILWFMTLGKTRPLYSLGRVSLLFGLVATLMLGTALFDKLINGHAMADRPIFFFGILFSLTSMIFITLAFILETTSSIFGMMENSTGYIVRECIRAPDSPLPRPAERDPAPHSFEMAQ